MQVELAKTLIERVDADIRELRAEMRRHSETVETRLDDLQRQIKANGRNGNGGKNGPLGMDRKDIVMLAILAKLAGFNLAQLAGWVG